jgi:hypothetical protein
MKPLARKMRSRKYGFQAGNTAHKLRRKAELHVSEPVSYRLRLRLIYLI